LCLDSYDDFNPIAVNILEKNDSPLIILDLMN
jgi:hypothetical protein